MKNVQIIDGAINSSYSIFQFTDEQFSMIFPGFNQDIEFIEDVQARMTEGNLDRAFEGAWKRPVKKPDAIGIRGTLFYELLRKKEFYPNKRSSDVQEV